MALAAAQVVDAVAARINALPAYAGKVFTDRAWPIGEAELPAWRVTAASELVERQDVGSAINEHQLTIKCQAFVKAVTGLDDAMHAAAAAGMASIFAEPVPHALQLTSIERQMSSEGEAAVGVITVSVLARFYVDQSSPETIL
jgi:hypothetical protein